MVLGVVFSPNAIIVDLQSEDKEEVIAELVEQLVAHIPGADRSQLLSSVLNREEKMSTGIMPGIAIPHGKSETLNGIHGVIGISRSGIDFDSLDGKPTYLFLLIISSTNESERHLFVLKRLAQILENKSFYKEIMEQKSPSDIHRVLVRYEDQLGAV
ncbi:MAG: PTS sugar transporter subunit IIA [Spirochaetaceae bacterium]|nr:PTS sugar transporter subunit IIA [Spirochaetaceae bacterium]